MLIRSQFGGTVSVTPSWCYLVGCIFHIVGGVYTILVGKKVTHTSADDLLPGNQLTHDFNSSDYPAQTTEIEARREALQIGKAKTTKPSTYLVELPVKLDGAQEAACNLQFASTEVSPETGGLLYIYVQKLAASRDARESAHRTAPGAVELTGPCGSSWGHEGE